MAFPWPAKKEAREPGSKPEFPSDLEDDLPEALPAEYPAAGGGKGENPLKVARDSSPRTMGAAGGTRSVPATMGGESDPLPALTQRLEKLGQMLDEAKDQVTSYLLHRESQTGGDDAARAIARKIEALAERLEQGGGSRNLDQKLDALYGKIDQLASAAPRSSAIAAGGESGGTGGLSEAALKSGVRPVVEKIEQLEARLKSIDTLKDALLPALAKMRDGQTEQHNAMGAGIRQLAEMVPQYFNALPQYFTAVQQQVVAAQQHTDAGLRAIIDILRPPQPEPSAAEPVIGGDWQEALLGGELSHNPALKNDKNRLVSGVLSGDPGACGLVGSLLLFRAAAADKMPPLLKDIGEAFYRWQPKTGVKPSEMEKALADWLMKACDQAGMANTIELVNPGERFDSTRHNAPRPGVEIAQVLGWIVLRDNGRVYTKASVAVK